MKKLLFLSVVFSALLIIGCQENSIVDPNAGPANKTANSPTSGTIQLKASLDNPYPVFNSYFSIDGEVSYEINVVDRDPIPPNSQQVITLKLNVDAELNSICTVCSPLQNQTPAGLVSAETDDVFNETDDGGFRITKTFQIQKRDDGMLLKCSFFVTANEIILDAVWLELNDQDVAVLSSK